MELTQEQESTVLSLYHKIGRTSELEVMFNNYKVSNKMKIKSYKKLIEYYKNRSRIQNLEIINQTMLDISLKLNKGSFRLSISGTENINRYINMVGTRNNHVIFKILLNHMKNDESITIIKKTKSQDDILDVDDFDIRYRLSEEMKTTEKDIKELKEINSSYDSKIMFRYKQRLSMVVSSDTKTDIISDLTKVFMSSKMTNIMNQTPVYEMELEINKKSEDTKFLEKLNKETNIILRVLQQSMFIISNTEKQTVLNSYREYMNANETKPNLNGRKPVSFKLEHLELVMNNYCATDKADGDRYFLIINNQKVYLISNNLDVKFTGHEVEESYNNTIMDGELIFLNKKNRFIFMVFDCMYHNNNDLRQMESFAERMQKASEIINECFGGDYERQIYSGNYNTDSIREFYKNDIESYFTNLNNDIDNMDNKMLIRTKYFLYPFGYHNSEIYLMTEIIWQMYVLNSDKICPYTLDGVIYQSINQKYTVGKDIGKPEYKWKPADKNSIDFYIEIEKDSETGRDYVLYDNSFDEEKKSEEDIGEDINFNNMYYKVCRLYVGRENKETKKEEPILFTYNEIPDIGIAHIPIIDGEIRDIDGNIIQSHTVVEFAYNNDKLINPKFRWIALRTRDDKTETVYQNKKGYGNYYSIALDTWASMINHISISDIDNLSKPNTHEKHLNQLLNRIDYSQNLGTGYYIKQTNIGYLVRQYHNWIKSNMIYTYCNKEYEDGTKLTVLDIGCGRGGDIQKFYYPSIKYSIGFDPSYEGLIQYRQRYNGILKNKRKYPDVPQMDVVLGNAVIPLDFDSQNAYFNRMTQQDKEIYETYFNDSGHKFDRINCQFSLHYYLESDETFNIFCDNINKTLISGGYMMITCFDGQLINNLFQESDFYERKYTDMFGNEKTFFSIRKQYTDVPDVFNTGYKIDVYNSMINEDGVTYPEFLVDPAFLIQQFREKCDLVLHDTCTFEQLYDLNKPFFEYDVFLEESVDSTRKGMFTKVSKFYKDETEENIASKEYSFLNRLYIFKKL